MDFSLKGYNRPTYIIEEELLRQNLKLIKKVGQEAGIEIILAFKAFAMWRAFPVFKEYISGTTASSVNEARLSFEEMKTLTHAYSPAYTDNNFQEFLKYSSHISFNSLSQYYKFLPQVKNYSRKVSCGLRINPGYSPVKTALYNPSAPGSRLGISPKDISGKLPEGIEGFHCHNLCESNSFDLEKTLVQIEELFGDYLDDLKWINIGGGHLMTRKGYNVSHLVNVLLSFKAKHSRLHIIMEPGSAFLWQTGKLYSHVVDIVENNNIKTAILDVSFACHMPDCLEMPYTPEIEGAEIINNEINEPVDKGYIYRMGGNSCLSGDFAGDYLFKHEIKPGDQIAFKDMIHYTTVKTTMFNGIDHPSIGIKKTGGQIEIWREFTYEDYKSRMD